ncbi:hypothetical protein SARC_05088 [Sphaeroforma arctica JP610]|uniref:Uncharacterized protein n=1 Tax=Sphaeroforma arctica JP610 TaxID=667725 RepID=A0A0L0G0K2_9EUKA|nr:hypothetical protein SARC_05088 [Sphaeroforma arctica JP610]KNC82632.1 hypothetical protein SARC_05088 [Sphaeroforma arctica JP610]|eukprot:XP_014156534.1 hypothetical protein SARC_05088 [Sphaeroforma arctica JP610]
MTDNLVLLGISYSALTHSAALHGADPIRTTEPRGFLVDNGVTLRLYQSFFHQVDTILSFLNSWASENPSRRVIWLSGTATHNGLRFKMFRTTTRVQRANEMVQEYIRKYKYDRIEYMDIYHMTLSRPDRSYDGIHYTLRSSKLKQKSRHTARATEPGFCDGDWFDQQMYRQIDYPDSLVRIQARMVLDTLMRTT